MSRLLNWNGGDATLSKPHEDHSDQQASVVSLPDVTADMIDEAVDATLEDCDPATADTMRQLWSMDAKSDVAHAYFNTQAKTRLTAGFYSVERRDVVIKYALQDDEVKVLTQYAPEFRLIFRNVVQHDHALPAAMRVVDHNLLLSRVPPRVRIKDVGGSVNFHSHYADRDVHLCRPEFDLKDSSRQTVEIMNMRQMLRDNQASEASLRFAAAVVDDDQSVVCRKTAMRCHEKARITMSVHVHDVPLSQWPIIMENAGALLHEGCVHFSNMMFEQTEGVMPNCGARYVIDLGRDEFRMGFQGSAAQWYAHKWSEFMCYGADQILYSKTSVYSYKIRERRGDTIYFRIMRVDAHARPNMVQTYVLPTIPVVEVKGFSVQNKTGRGERLAQTYNFPAALWNQLMTQAALEFERGTLDYNKMVNYYRTVAPRQTINAVLVMGGETVGLHDIVPLIAHVCVCAATDVLLTQRATRATTDDYVRLRSIEREGTLYKSFMTVLDSLKLAGCAVLYPFAAVASVIRVAHLNTYMARLAEWRPVPLLRHMSAKVMLPSHMQSSQFNYVIGDQLLDDVDHEMDFLDIAMNDHEVAQRLLNVCGDDLDSSVANRLNSVVLAADAEPVGSAAKPAVEFQSPPPSYRTEPSVIGSTSHEQRILAIKECIVEAEMENRKTEAASARAYRELVHTISPSVNQLKENAERLGNPDMWYVDKGTIMYSILGLTPQDFRCSAVYVPEPDPNSGSYIRSVASRVWKGVNRVTGDFEVRHYRTLDPPYTGWALTTDSLDVFNGPEIIRSLQEALELRHDYKVTIEQAPPGSGKTYTIIHSAAVDDVVLCPVKQSSLDTRAQVVKLWRDQGRGVDEEHVNLRFKTLDAYLVNCRNNRSLLNLATQVLRADECYMAPAGKWYAAAAKLGIKHMYAYGDEKQIPHVPRVQAPKLHVRLKPDVVDYKWLTRRCPAELVAAWGSVYDWKVRTLSTEVGRFVRVKSMKGEIPPKGCVMMCMYQADKVTLRSIYSQYLENIIVMTAHESEGKTFDHVWLHNFEMRRRAPEDSHYLFFKEPYCLVACSRSRKTLIYVKHSDESDLVTEWLARSADPRRVEAAKDRASAGESKEFI